MINKDEQIKDLIELNDELENYFRNTIIPQLFVDANLILRKVTPRALKQFDLLEDDIGKLFTDIKDKFRFKTIVDDIQQVISSTEVLEKEVQTTDKRWYQMNIMPYLTMKDKKANGVIVSFVEITQRIKALKDLEQEVKNHEILLDTISHDIKTPLSSLLSAFQIIKLVPRGDVDQIHKLLEIQVRAVAKMQTLIAELTDSREEEHKYKTNAELLDFEHIIEDVRLTLNDEIVKSGAIIHTDFQVANVSFPRRELRSIIYNLVGNAIKYKSAERTPEVWITTGLEDKFVVISIKDNGAGIAESDQKKIFSKYVRLDSNVEGSGLGLYLVKEHITKAGGRITLHSEPGKGSEFTVYLKAS